MNQGLLKTPSSEGHSLIEIIIKEKLIELVFLILLVNEKNYSNFDVNALIKLIQNKKNYNSFIID
ncbi:hypothetical protein BpHYR1_044943 [Brachionus plicatilis]|uniref:Uncharacterized protein n=1 Tax=Brachionus plicatilis TaxID=10195 RepID=A0A3M7S067_BRAPC|nr:hypothetical protein BpHYR1_044943 [Brachionus plicatilis]